MKKILLFLLLFSVGFTHAQNINKIEYFIDADPEFGSGTDVPNYGRLSSNG